MFRNSCKNCIKKMKTKCVKLKQNYDLITLYNIIKDVFNEFETYSNDDMSVNEIFETYFDYDIDDDTKYFDKSFTRCLCDEIDLKINEFKDDFKNEIDDDTITTRFMYNIILNFYEFYDDIECEKRIFIACTINYFNANNINCKTTFYCTFDVDDFCYIEHEYCVETFANMLLKNNNMIRIE